MISPRRSLRLVVARRGNIGDMDAKPIRFSLRQLACAVAWLSISAALVGIGLRADLQIEHDLCIGLSAAAAGTGIGVLFHRPGLGAVVGVSALMSFLRTFGFLLAG